MEVDGDVNSPISSSSQSLSSPAPAQSSPANAPKPLPSSPSLASPLARTVRPRKTAPKKEDLPPSILKKRVKKKQKVEFDENSDLLNCSSDSDEFYDVYVDCSGSESDAETSFARECLDDFKKINRAEELNIAEFRRLRISIKNERVKLRELIIAKRKENKLPTLNDEQMERKIEEFYAVLTERLREEREKTRKIRFYVKKDLRKEGSDDEDYTSMTPEMFDPEIPLTAKQWANQYYRTFRKQNQRRLRTQKTFDFKSDVARSGLLELCSVQELTDLAGNLLKDVLLNTPFKGPALAMVLALMGTEEAMLSIVQRSIEMIEFADKEPSLRYLRHLMCDARWLEIKKPNMKRFSKMLEWMFDYATESLLKSDEDKVDPTILRLSACLLEHISQNELFSTILSLSKKPECFEETMKALEKSAEIAQEHSQRILDACDNFRIVFGSSLEFKGTDFLPNVMLEHHYPGSVRSLVTNFACYRTHVPVCEVIGTFHFISELFGIEPETVIKEIIFACMIIQVDHCKEPAPIVEAFILVKMPWVLKGLNVAYGFPEGKIEEIIKNTFDEANQLVSVFNAPNLRFLLYILHCEGLISVSFAEAVFQMRGEIDDSAKVDLQIAFDHLKNLSIGVTVFDEIINVILSSGGLMADAFCGIYNTISSVLDFSKKLINVNNTSVSGHNDLDARLRQFSISFTLLYRITIKFPHLNYDEICHCVGVDDRDMCPLFFLFATEFIQRIGFVPRYAKQVLDNPDEYLQKATSLMQQGHFWDADADFKQVLFELPRIWQTLSSEFENLVRESRDHLKAIVDNTIHNAPFVVISLVQWLKLQPNTGAKLEMGRIVRVCLDNINTQITNGDSARLAVETLIPVVDDMVNELPFVDTLAHTVIAMGERKLPPVDEIHEPDKQALKCGWFYAQKAGWCCPDVMRMVDHCNRAGQHSSWIYVFMHNMLRNNTADELLATGELVLSIVFSDIVQSLSPLMQSLIDYVVPENTRSGVGSLRLRFEPPHLLPLGRLTVNTFLIGEWLVAQAEFAEATREENSAHPQNKKAKAAENRANAGLYLTESDKAAIESLKMQLSHSISTLVNRFEQLGVTSVTSFIAHFLEQLAIARPPESSPFREIWNRFTNRIPLDNIRRLSAFEPYVVTLPLFMVFCPPSTPENILICQEFAAALHEYRAA